MEQNHAGRKGLVLPALVARNPQESMARAQGLSKGGTGKAGETKSNSGRSGGGYGDSWRSEGVVEGLDEGLSEGVLESSAVTRQASGLAPLLKA
jgi:hypothetical protein